MTISRLAAVAMVTVMVGLGCSEGPTPMDPAHLAELEAWRARRLERLTAPDGWLTLVGLDWLEPGENTVGAAAGTDVRLPEGGAPALVGVLELGPDGTVTLRPEADAGVTVDGEPVTTETVLASDASGAPSLVRAGRILLYVVARGDRLGVRIKDPEAETRTGFTGIESYPPDARFRVPATFEPYPEPKTIAVPSVAGTESEGLVPGVLRFQLEGRELTLEPMVDDPDDEQLFVVFADATSGVTTYGACRFLTVERPTPGTETTIDFNYAYNPPCAFTPYATCPLPPPGNRLPVAVEAGERSTEPAH